MRVYIDSNVSTYGPIAGRESRRVPGYTTGPHWTGPPRYQHCFSDVKKVLILDSLRRRLSRRYHPGSLEQAVKGATPLPPHSPDGGGRSELEFFDSIIEDRDFGSHDNLHMLPPWMLSAFHEMRIPTILHWTLPLGHPFAITAYPSGMGRAFLMNVDHRLCDAGHHLQTP